MLIKIFTANVGHIDTKQSIIDQSVYHEYEVFTYPMEGLTDRQAGKYYKTACLALQDADIAIWLDHRVNVIGSKFVEWVKDAIKGQHMIIPQHPDRKSIGDEYKYILTNLDKPYLSVRYANEDWQAEIDAYGKHLDAPLVNPRFFAIDLRKKLSRQLLNDWYNHILMYTIFDQCSISYLLHTYSASFKYICPTWAHLSNYLEVIPHKELK